MTFFCRNSPLWNHLDSNLNWIIFDFWQMIIPRSGDEVESLRPAAKAAWVQDSPVLAWTWCPRILCKDLSFLSADNQSIARDAETVIVSWDRWCHGHVSMVTSLPLMIMVIMSPPPLPLVSPWSTNEQPGATREVVKNYFVSLIQN